jgi:hypothetical protein
MIEDPCVLETTLMLWECEKYKSRTERFLKRFGARLTR